MERVKLAAKASGFTHDQRGQALIQGGLIGAVISFIVAFYVLSTTYPSMETAAVNLNTSLANSALPNISTLGSLPGIILLLFILVTLFALLLANIRQG